jgi:hypothetical protein
MLKADPHPDYPPEDGRYLRGNERSPVAVAIILNTSPDKIPPELESVVRAGIEAGDALSGAVQTEKRCEHVHIIPVASRMPVSGFWIGKLHKYLIRLSTRWRNGRKAYRGYFRFGKKLKMKE